MIKGAAQKHKEMFERFLIAANTTVTVRQPAARTVATNPQDKVRGTRTFESAVGATKDVAVIWSNDLIVGPENTSALNMSSASEIIAAVGGKTNIDAVVRCRLLDVLIDTNNAQGRTLFETAKDVQFSGNLYKVQGMKRTGLAPLGPYVLWVGLKMIPYES